MRAKVAAILLAAGAARRMGRCKQLLLLEGKTVIAHCLESLLAGGIEEVIVVVGPEGERVAWEAMGYPVRVVRNAVTECDMAASVSNGRDALSDGAGAVLVALCDHPLVKGETIASLIKAHHLHPEDIIVPFHNGRHGHPVLFPRQLLAGLQPPLTLRDILRANPDRIEHLAVSDGGVLIDMDTPEDYQRVLEIYRQEAAAFGGSQSYDGFTVGDD